MYGYDRLVEYKDDEMTRRRGYRPTRPLRKIKATPFSSLVNI